MYFLQWCSSAKNTKITVETKTTAPSEMIQNSLVPVPVELYCSLRCTKWIKNAVYLVAGIIFMVDVSF